MRIFISENKLRHRVAFTQNGVNRGYRRCAHSYDWDQKEWAGYPRRPEFFKELDISPGARTLEVAAGTGLNFYYYVNGGNHHATDNNKGMIFQARQRIEETGVHYTQSHAKTLPYDDNMFDVAFITYGLSTIPGAHKVLWEMQRVVRPGGKIGVLDFNRTGYFSSIYNHTVPFSLKRTVKKTGLECEINKEVRETSWFIHGGQSIQIFRVR